MRRREEMLNIEVGHIEDRDDCVKIKISNTKTKITREFVISGAKFNGINLLDLFRKYAALRPKNYDGPRFFLGYKYSKCI